MPSFQVPESPKSHAFHELINKEIIFAFGLWMSADINDNLIGKKESYT
jgi:hypothetical protein